MMGIDEAILTAYLDNELPEREHQQVEAQLGQSPQAQARLAQLRHETTQLNEALDSLASITRTQPSAWLALKRLRPQLQPALEAKLSTPVETPAASIWESPSLLNEVKNGMTNFKLNWRRSSLLAAALITVTGLIGISLLLLRLPLENTPQVFLPTDALDREIESGVKPASSPEAAQEIITTQVISEAVQALPESGVPAPAAAGAFSYGIEVNPRGDTPANVTHLKTLGFEWVKLPMDWAEVEPVRNQYDWRLWDKVIGLYADGNIKILLTISKAPVWARPLDDDKSLVGLPRDPADYAGFVAQVARRYQGQVKAIEVWQGQNVYYNVGGEGRVDPASYVKLLEAAYKAIKAANPEVSVISGGLTPTGASLPLAMDDIEYLDQMYSHGANRYFDALGAHLPGFANPPDAFYKGDGDPTRGYDDHRTFFFRNTIEAYRQVMLEHQDEGKRIWPTQFGWPVARYTDERYLFAQENSLEEQAEYTARAYEMAQAWGWVGPMFLNNLDYNLTGSNTELANFGILESPTYERLATARSIAPAELGPVGSTPNDQDRLLLSLAGKIYTINSDGTQLAILTNGPEHWSAFWSPDRQHILFMSQKEGKNSLYLMNTDGREPVQLNDEPGIYLPPQWSPDGQKLALTLRQENSSWDLYSLNVAEKRLTPLANTLDSVAGPVWSPDGQQLAFAAYHNERYDIYTLEVDSNKLVNLTRFKEGSTNWSPVWSPDGRRLAFISNRTDIDNVYIMNKDGTGVNRLTDNPAGTSRPFGLSWSPGGDYLTFLLEEKVVDLYLVALESQVVTRLTDQVGVDIFLMDWSPEGRRIGFLTTTDREELELNIIDVGQLKTTVVPLPRELRGPGYIDWAPPK